MELTVPSNRKNLRVYLHHVKMGMLEMWAWRAEFIGDFIRIPLTVSMHLLLFLFIYAENESINGFSRAEGLSYILIVSMIASGFASGHMSRILNQHIVEGDLMEYLIRPVNIHFMYFSNQYAYRIYMAVLYTVAYALALLFFPILYVPDLLDVIYAWFIVFLGYTISMQFYYLIGLLAFWLGNVTFINRVLRAMQEILGGRYFPLAWLPGIIFTITQFLPFMVLYHLPGLIIIGKMSIAKSIPLLLSGIAWLIILQMSIKFVFGMGLKRFDGAGD